MSLSRSWRSPALTYSETCVHVVGLDERARHVVRRVDDDGDLGHGRNTSPASLRPTLRPRGGNAGDRSHGTRRFARRAAAGRARRPRARDLAPRSRLGNLADLDVEQVECDVLDRRAVRRAMRGVDRVFHVAGLTNLRADADTLFRINVLGTHDGARGGACRRRRALSSTPRRSPPSGPRRAARPPTSARSSAGRYGLPYINAKHEAEKEALRIGGARPAGRRRQPGARVRRGDVYHSSTELVRRFLRREIPAYVDGALNIVDAEDVARGQLLADERGHAGGALHPGQSQLHARPSLRRPRPVERGGATGAEAAARSRDRARARTRAQPASAGAPADHRRRGARGVAVVGISLHEGQARARLEAGPPRGHAADHDRLVPRPRALAPAQARHAPAAAAARRGLRRAAGRRRRRGSLMPC